MVKRVYTVTIEGVYIKTVWNNEIEKVFTFRYEHTYKPQDREDCPCYCSIWDDFRVWCGNDPQDVRVQSASFRILLIRPYHGSEKSETFICRELHLNIPYPYNFDGFMYNKYQDGKVMG